VQEAMDVDGENDGTDTTEPSQEKIYESPRKTATSSNKNVSSISMTKTAKQKAANLEKSHAVADDKKNTLEETPRSRKEAAKATGNAKEMNDDEGEDYATDPEILPVTQQDILPPRATRSKGLFLQSEVASVKDTVNAFKRKYESKDPLKDIIHDKKSTSTKTQSSEDEHQVKKARHQPVPMTRKAVRPKGTDDDEDYSDSESDIVIVSKVVDGKQPRQTTTTSSQSSKTAAADTKKSLLQSRHSSSKIVFDEDRDLDMDEEGDNIPIANNEEIDDDIEEFEESSPAKKKGMMKSPTLSKAMKIVEAAAATVNASGVKGVASFLKKQAKNPFTKARIAWTDEEVFA
jgi:hypothetical protein